MLNTLAKEADVMCAGYEVGYFNKLNLIRWADHWILRLDVPPDALLDVSMCRLTDRYDITKLLMKLGERKEESCTNLMIGFLGLLQGQERSSLARTIDHLCGLQISFPTTKRQESEILGLECDYYCALHYSEGTLGNVEQSLRNFLSPYLQTLQENFLHLLSLS